MAQKYSFLLSAISLAVLSACSEQPTQATVSSAVAEAISTVEAVSAPVAKKVPYEMEIHGNKRVDDYYWMRDDKREDPEILAHLDAENRYNNLYYVLVFDTHKALFLLLFSKSNPVVLV